MNWKARIWLLIIIVLAVIVPVIADHIRKKDYQDQVNGKKATRRWKGKISYDKPTQPDLKYEELKEEATRKALENITGF